MNELKLTHIPNSRSVRTLWLLHEIGCEFAVEVFGGAMSPLEALHPTISPALSDGDVTIHETGAMIEWLCETRAPHLWREPGAPGRLGWLDWLHFGETLLGRVGASPRCRLTSALDTLEGWLKGSEWLLDDFSGADCQIGYSVWVASQIAGLDRYPALISYLARCAHRPAFRKAIIKDVVS